jgi:benzylmalate synthase
METIKLIISDETLRDGAQQVGIFFEDDTKHDLAQQIAQTGVQQIALMPAVHTSETELVKTLVAEGLGSQVVASTMLNRSRIEQSNDCGVQQVILFNAVSDRLLFLRDPEISFDLRYRHKTIDDDIPGTVIQAMRQRMQAWVLEHLQYAANLGLQVTFAFEDASRADFDFLVDCIQRFQPYVQAFLLCDTVGMLTPDKAYVWIHDLLECTHSAQLLVHFHNDMGLALENTMQAILAGAAGVSGTFGGIGERAGNVALEQVLDGLRLRFGQEVAGINYDAIAQVTGHLEHLGARANPPYSPQAQRHETGIHVHSLLRDRKSYSIFPHLEPDIWFGKYSGSSNVQYLFEHHLGRALSKERYRALRSQIKALSIRAKRSFSIQEVLELIQQGALRIEDD